MQLALLFKNDMNYDSLCVIGVLSHPDATKGHRFILPDSVRGIRIKSDEFCSRWDV